MKSYISALLLSFLLTFIFIIYFKFIHVIRVSDSFLLLSSILSYEYKYTMIIYILIDGYLGYFQFVLLQIHL